jgi:hypothetical protein
MTKPRPKMVFDNTAEKPANPTESYDPGRPGPAKPVQASRLGRRAVTFYLKTDAFKQLGILSAQTDRTVQDLMTEQVNELFQKHNLSRIA